MRRIIALPALLALGLLVLGLTAPGLPAHAEDSTVSGEAQQLAADILACEQVAFGTCPALATATSSRDAVARGLAEQLRGAGAAKAGKIALALSLLDGRSQLDALNDAAAALPNDPSAVDIRAAQARLGDIRAAGPLLAELHSPLERNQILAAGALGVLRHQPAVAPLRQLLLHGPRGPQLAAAVALGLLGDKDAETDLLSVAASPETVALVRAAALNALAAQHSRLAVPLATMLVDTRPAEVARAALRVLDAAALPWTDTAAATGLETPGARGEAAKAVVTLKMTAAGVKLLDVALRDDLEPEERVALYDALAVLRPSGASAALVQRLKKLPAAGQTEEGVLILRLVAKLEDKSVAVELVPLLRLDNKTLVGQVVHVLETLTGEHFGADEKPWRVLVGLDAKPAQP